MTKVQEIQLKQGTNQLQKLHKPEQKNLGKQTRNAMTIKEGRERVLISLGHLKALEKIVESEGDIEHNPRGKTKQNRLRFEGFLGAKP